MFQKSARDDTGIKDTSSQCVCSSTATGGDNWHKTSFRCFIKLLDSSSMHWNSVAVDMNCGIYRLLTITKWIFIYGAQVDVTISLRKSSLGFPVVSQPGLLITSGFVYIVTTANHGTLVSQLSIDYMCNHVINYMNSIHFRQVSMFSNSISESWRHCWTPDDRKHYTQTTVRFLLTFLKKQHLQHLWY